MKFYPEVRVGVDASMLAPPMAGLGNYLRNLLTELRTVDVPVEYFLYSQNGLSLDFQDLGVFRDRVWPNGVQGPLWMSSGLPRWLSRDAIDVFWGANGYLPLIMPATVQTVVTIHDFVHRVCPRTMPRLARVARSLLQPLAIRQASVVTVNSLSTASDLARFYRRSADLVILPRCDQIYSEPVAKDEVENIFRRYDLPRRFILSVGTLEPRKNTLALIEAYRNCLSRCTEKLPTLVLVGASGWLDSEVRLWIDAMQREGYVRWLGYVPQQDMPAFYTACEFFIYVPLYEGFGMPVREALLCGARVLASDIPALREAGENLPTYVEPSISGIEAGIFHMRNDDRQLNLPQREGKLPILRGSVEDLALTFLQLGQGKRLHRKRVSG